MTMPIRISAPRLLLFALLLFISVYPIVRLLLVTLLPALAPPQAAALGNAQHALSLLAVRNTLRIGVEAGLGALIPGIALGFILERFAWRGEAFLAACLWLLLMTPSYLLSTGWQLAAFKLGPAPGSAFQLLFSEFGIVVLLALKGLPFACLSARMGWSGIGDEMTAALRIHVQSPWRRTIILGRLLAPAAGSVFAVVFIEAITDFGVAATLGAHLRMPLVIYGVDAALARTPVDFAEAARLSLVLVLMAGAAVGLHHCLRTRGAMLSGRSRPNLRTIPSRWGEAAAWLALAMLVSIAFVVPGAALFARAMAVDEPARLSAENLASIGWSLAYAFVGATLSVLIATALLTRGDRPSLIGGRLFDAATLGAMAVPAIALGAAYVIAFNGWLPLYGTPVLLLMGFVATHLPPMSRFLIGPLGNGHASLADAARLHGLHFGARIELIHLPLLLRPLLWGWAIVFTSIFFELPLSSLLHPVGRAPIGVSILSLDETLRFADEARLALLGMLTCLVMIFVMAGLLPRWLTRRPPPLLPQPAVTT